MLSPSKTRLVLAAALALASFALAPAAASASSKQLSIIEDNRVFLGSTTHDPEAALAQAKLLGADAVRVFITWSRVAPGATTRTKPAGFDAASPAGYDWSNYDLLMARARRNNLKVIFDLAGSIPYWASSEPTKCPHFVGGYRNLGKSCFWKPKASEFGAFTKAVATHFKGNVFMYSLWNEPNLEHQLYPQVQKTKSGTVDLGGKMFRQLWIAGQKGIAAGDPALRNKVLFGEVAAISSPMDTLYSALCLTEKGKPYTGRMKALQGCSKPSSLPIGGLSIHPYNKDALGTVFSKSATVDSMPMAYASRATRVLRVAEKYKRVPRGRGIYVSEFGFQSRPPDPHGLSLTNQATQINNAERLFFGDPRIRSVSQYELYDEPEVKGDDVYNTGLLTNGGKVKPARDAYRMPLVVTKLGGNRVEIWGGVRIGPAGTTPVVETSSSSRGPWKRLSGTRTNSAGYFRFTKTVGNATRLRYRVTWRDAKRVAYHSRVAVAGAKIGYREKP